MKKILFPFDFSEASLNAFRYALHLAHKIHAEILTVHAFEEAGIYTDYYEVVFANYQVSTLDEFENFKDKVPKLRAIIEEENLPRVQIKHLLQKGGVAATILEVAESQDIDFIVMGTTGATGLAETFVGSVTEEVMNRAKCSVLAVPLQARYRAMRNILFLTKYKRSDIAVLQQVQKTAKLFAASISVLHVKPHHDDSEQERLSEFKAAFTGAPIRFHILASHDAEDTINDFIEIEEIDLLVMRVHHKNFFQSLFVNSLSRKLVYHSKIPLLSIPDAIK